MSTARLILSIASLCTALATTTHVHAQVLAIGDDGGVTTFAGPSVHTDQGAQLIVAAPRDPVVIPTTKPRPPGPPNRPRARGA